MNTNTIPLERECDPFIKTDTGTYPILPETSSQGSATSSTCLAQDPSQEHDAEPSDTFSHQLITLSEAFSDEDIHYVEIGDILIDAEGVGWLCRSCFCGSAGCYGKIIVRLESKEELEGWDRGGNLCRRRRVNMDVDD
jgi:hypothetical protein